MERVSQPGDVILTIAGRNIRYDEDVLNCVRGHVEGERVPVGFWRAVSGSDLFLTLVAKQNPLPVFRPSLNMTCPSQIMWWAGRRSRRRAGRHHPLPRPVRLHGDTRLNVPSNSWRY